MSTEIIDKAIKFAVDAHSGAIRKGNGNPYILHPLEVAAIAGTMTNDVEVLAAAVLHDTVEDTATTMEDIRSAFGQRVAALVATETEDKRPEMPPSASWKIRKEESIAELANTKDVAVKILWLSDKLSNMRSFYDMWVKDGDDFWNRFNQPDKAEQAWYYRAIDGFLGELDDFNARKEYHFLVETVFADVPQG